MWKIFPRQTGNVASLTGNAIAATHKTRPSQRVRKEHGFLIQSPAAGNETTQVEFHAFWYFRRCVHVTLARRNLHATHNVEAFAFNAANFILRFIRDRPELGAGSLKSVLASGQREIRG